MLVGTFCLFTDLFRLALTFTGRTIRAVSQLVLLLHGTAGCVDRLRGRNHLEAVGVRGRALSVVLDALNNH